MTEQTIEKKQTKSLTPAELAKLCANVADARKAEEVVVLNMMEMSSIADFFVLCTGKSEPHLKAVCDWIGREVREKAGIKPRSTDGTAASQWMLLDYGTVIVHIMTPEMRNLYQLESLWGDAPRMEAVKVMENAVVAK